MTGPNAQTDLMIRASRPVVNAQVVPGPPGPPGASGFGVMASGSHTVQLPTGQDNVLSTVPFPEGRFSHAPQVTAWGANGTHLVSLGAITATEFTVRATRLDNSTAANQVTVHWIAVLTTGPGQPPAGYPVVATNLFTRPSPTSALPWAVIGAGSSAIYMDDPEMGSFVRFTPGSVSSALQSAVSFVAGDTYVGSSYLRNNGPAPLSFWLATNVAVLEPQTVPNDGVWRRYWSRFIAPAAGQFRPVQVAANTGTIDVARASVTPGTALLDFFDGNTPGGRWTGAVGNSIQELLAPRGSDLTAFAREDRFSTPFATNLLNRPVPTVDRPWNIAGVQSPPSTVEFLDDPQMGPFARLSVTSSSAAGALSAGQYSGAVQGRTYTGSVWLRNNGPNPVTQVRLRALSNSPDSPAQTGAFFTVPPDGVWRRYSLAWVQGNNTATPSFRPADWSTGATIHVDIARASVTEGVVLADFFDGDSVGARWLGASGDSASQLVGARPVDIQAVVQATEMVGVGMPEGAVVAPVGTRYTDTAATNGAVRWIKQTGTGVTGWRVLWGDTGSRQVSSLLINGWTSPSLLLRRVGDVVNLQWQSLVNTAATADAFLPYIAGFGGGWIQARDLPATPVPNTVRVTIPSSVSQFTLGRGFPVVAQQVVWVTTEAWPTTLP